MTNKELREKLAELEHEQWIAWSKSIAEDCAIGSERRERWEKLWRPYSELTEEEKDQDRKWADKVLANINTDRTALLKEILKDIKSNPGWYEMEVSDYRESVIAIIDSHITNQT